MPLLPKLRKLEMGTNDTFINCYLRALGKFASLPSLTRVHATNFRVYAERLSTKTFPNESNITEIKLTECDIHTIELCAIIRMCSFLENFSYEPFGRNNDDERY